MCQHKCICRCPTELYIYVRECNRLTYDYGECNIVIFLNMLFTIFHQAFDDDEGENGVSTYSIVAVVQGEPLFRVDRATGIFSTTQSLEGEEAGSQFEYTVLAEDPNNNFTIAETMVKVFYIFILHFLDSHPSA